MSRNYLLRASVAGVAVALFIILASVAVMAASNTTTAEASTQSVVNELVTKLLTNPKALIAVLIQFFLGFALGYYSAKVVKYILALIAIIVLGSVLSVWSIGGNVNDFLTHLGTEAVKLWPVIQGILATFGIMTVAPITVGFILGAVIAFTRK